MSSTQLIKAVPKIWSGNTYGTRLQTQNHWYVGNYSLGTSITTGDWVDDVFEKPYYPYFIAAHACVITSVGFAGGTSWSNDYEVQFWHINFDSGDTQADSASQVGTTISLSSPGTSHMLFRQVSGLSVSLAVGDCVFHVARFTSGGTNKYLYINPVIGYK